MLQAERVRDAAWGCDWVGTPVHFQKSIKLIITAANKEVTLTAGKFVPVRVRTMVNVRLYFCVYLEYELLDCDTVQIWIWLQEYKILHFVITQKITF
jgi:hypothetical protein